MTLAYIAVFIFGCVFGSFLNCVLYRMEQGKSFVKGGSFCPKCKHKLSFRDLVPILSFIILKSRCRYCKKKISVQYPIVEVATGVLFFLIFWHLDFLFFVFSHYYLLTGNDFYLRFKALYNS